ncbi:unnamed protein product [Paramecium primaurelia]|uniref:Uncharacterized protein n=1 Tax=Paramecium primaurelia TaxID=5886 RepID=A0A8S1KAA6_PARPR|nr:unnamed protein product [Paramecium primaurelia]
MNSFSMLSFYLKMIQLNQMIYFSMQFIKSNNNNSVTQLSQ